MKSARDIVVGYSGRPLRIMEVCGTHTHEIFRLGIRELLPPQVELISGPGCPVCVTPVSYIDEAVWLSLECGAVVCTFGDLIRVPGSDMSLAGARERGGEIRPVYTPSDAVDYAAGHPDRQVVFLAVGFETTVPAACLAVRQALRAGISNFSLLTANKTMPNAYMALRHSADAFLYPGHVHAIIGTRLCETLCNDGISGVVAGFDGNELLTALAMILEHAEDGKTFFANCYQRVVRSEGNPAARKLIEEMMEPCDAEWRGLGTIAGSGLRLRDAYRPFDARAKFAVPKITGRPNPACRCGDVLQGKIRPCDCPLFGKICTPQSPVGACMVSGEGACSAYYRYAR